MFLEVGADEVTGEPSVAPDLPEPVGDQLERTWPAGRPVGPGLSGGCHAARSVHGGPIDLASPGPSRARSADGGYALPGCRTQSPSREPSPMRLPASGPSAGSTGPPAGSAGRGSRSLPRPGPARAGAAVLTVEPQPHRRVGDMGPQHRRDPAGGPEPLRDTAGSSAPVRREVMVGRCAKPGSGRAWSTSIRGWPSAVRPVDAAGAQPVRASRRHAAVRRHPPSLVRPLPAG